MAACHRTLRGIAARLRDLSTSRGPGTAAARRSGRSFRSSLLASTFSLLVEPRHASPGRRVVPLGVEELGEGGALRVDLRRRGRRGAPGPGPARRGRAPRGPRGPGAPRRGRRHDDEAVRDDAEAPRRPRRWRLRRRGRRGAPGPGPARRGRAPRGPRGPGAPRRGRRHDDEAVRDDAASASSRTASSPGANRSSVQRAAHAEPSTDTLDLPKKGNSRCCSTTYGSHM